MSLEYRELFIRNVIHKYLVCVKISVLSLDRDTVYFFLHIYYAKIYVCEINLLLMWLFYVQGW